TPEGRRTAFGGGPRRSRSWVRGGSGEVENVADIGNKVVRLRPSFGRPSRVLGAPGSGAPGTASSGASGAASLGSRPPRRGGTGCWQRQQKPPPGALVRAAEWGARGARIGGSGGGSGDAREHPGEALRTARQDRRCGCRTRFAGADGPDRAGVRTAV